MNPDASLENGRGFVTLAKAQRERIGHRRTYTERGGQMPLAWWAMIAAGSAALAWALGNTLLRWLTLD